MIKNSEKIFSLRQFHTKSKADCYKKADFSSVEKRCG